VPNQLDQNTIIAITAVHMTRLIKEFLYWNRNKSYRYDFAKL